MKLTKKQLKEMVREEVLKETTLRNRSIRLDRVIREREVLRRIQEKYDENFGANSLKTDLAINMDLLDDAKGILSVLLEYIIL